MDKHRNGPVTTLKRESERLDAELKRCKDDYLRALAEFDNYRKRLEKESAQSQRLALERLVVDLLPVLDNFHRALQAVGGERPAESVQKGMQLIHRQLRETLCRHGLAEYSCLGAEFDPRRAEAISFVHTSEQKPGIVVSEVCKGYECDGRVIRPARVVVAKEASRSQESEVRSQNAEAADTPAKEIAEGLGGSKEEGH
jgi:molecular chaperone GrpE